MKTLDEHNKERIIFYGKQKPFRCKKPKIACPECKIELFYPSDMVTVTGLLRMEVSCKCGFAGEVTL